MFWCLRCRWSLTDSKHSMTLVYGEKKRIFFFFEWQSDRVFSFRWSYMRSPRSKSHRGFSEKPLSLFSLALSEYVLPWDSFAIALITVNLPKCSLHLHSPPLWRENRNHKGVITENVTQNKAVWGSTLDTNLKSYTPWLQKLTHPIMKTYTLICACNSCQCEYTLSFVLC